MSVDSGSGEHLARAADHYWPSNHAHYMPEPCAEILTEWLYPLAEDYLTLHAAANDALSWWENHGLFNPDEDTYLATIDALRAALSSEDATRPTPADSGPGCKNHRGDPHNLCEACWELEPDATRPTGDRQ